MKSDEIQGEVEYNVKTIPQEVHEHRNAFIDGNTELFLRRSGTDLSKDEVLIVGCSFPELLFFESRCKSITSLDIVPYLTRLFVSETRKRGMTAHWVCGDGECLPFRDGSFDTVIVRQGLHHLMKYHAAICEFFRVCRQGGRVLIIDEPFVDPCFNTPPLSLLPDDFPIFGKHTVGSLRKMPEESPSGLQAILPYMRRWMARFRPSRRRTANLDLSSIIALLDGARKYQKPDQDNAETLLADKYLSLSILSCLFLIGIHTSDFRLFWPDETAWVDMEGETPRFLHGPNPKLGDLPTMLTRTGWMSIVARKSSPTAVFRNRSGLAAMPLEAIPRN